MINLAHQGRLAGLRIKNSSKKSPRRAVFSHEKQMSSTSVSGLFHAVINGQIKKVLYLLNHGAPLNKNSRGFSPLVAALHIEDDRKRNRMFKILLMKGASYTVRDDQFDRTVMHWACILGHNQQVNTLLEETAGDINLLERDKDGLTALHHAVLAGHSATVEVLVKFHVRFGISVDIPDNIGITPYIHARRLGDNDIIDMLRNQGQACEEHADNLFRSPREWSFIGKNERHRAINCQIQNQIQIAKIMGKFDPTKKADSRASILNKVPLSDKFRRRSSDQTEESTSYLEGVDIVDSVKRSLETQHCLPSNAGLISNETMTKSVLETSDDNLNTHIISKSDFKVSSQSNQLSNNRTDTHASMTLQVNNTIPNLILPIIKQRRIATYSHNYTRQDAVNGNGKQNNSKLILGTILPTISSASSNQTALRLIEQTFPKARVTSEFHNSVFDTSKAAKYKYMLGNLSDFMEILSEQSTRSFRKTATLQKPDIQRTPSVIKKQNKISTWAILFGDKKEDSMRRRSRHLGGSFTKSKHSKHPRQKEHSVVNKA